MNSTRDMQWLKHTGIYLMSNDFLCNIPCGPLGLIANNINGIMVTEIFYKILTCPHGHFYNANGNVYNLYPGYYLCDPTLCYARISWEVIPLLPHALMSTYIRLFLTVSLISYQTQLVLHWYEPSIRLSTATNPTGQLSLVVNKILIIFSRNECKKILITHVPIPLNEMSEKCPYCLGVETLSVSSKALKIKLIKLH